MGQEDRIPLGWSDETLPLHSYVSFYYSSDDTMRRSLAFVRAGLDEPGTFCIILADSSRHDALLRDLQDGRREDLRELVAAGKLAIVGGVPTIEELAAPDEGTALGDLAIAVGGRMQEALAGGYLRIRAFGLVEWGRPAAPDMEALKRCEAEIKKVAVFFPVVVVCAYRLPQLAGQVILESGLGDDPTFVVHERVDAQFA